MLGMTSTFCRGAIKRKPSLMKKIKRSQESCKRKRTDLELALQFLLNPLGDVSEGDLPVPEHGTHVKV